MNYGITIISQIEELSEGLNKLIRTVAKGISITFAGGNENNVSGTKIQKIVDALNANESKEILVFYDTNSSKENIKLASQISKKNIHIYDVAMIEGAYITSKMISDGISLEKIEEKLNFFKIEKV